MPSSEKRYVMSDRSSLLNIVAEAAAGVLGQYNVHPDSSSRPVAPDFFLFFEGGMRTAEALQDAVRAMRPRLTLVFVTNRKFAAPPELGTAENVHYMKGVLDRGRLAALLEQNGFKPKAT